MDLPAIGDRVVWLRNGVVEVEQIKESAGQTFVIVRPWGWDGEPGWIASYAVDEQLRAIASKQVAQQRLSELRAPTKPRPAGDLLARRTRYARTLELGKPGDQVSALAHAYAEAHRPDVDDVRLLDALERLVLAEIASALGRGFEELRAELRAGFARFGDAAPRSGTIVEANDDGGFQVSSAIHVTDLDQLSLVLPARPGRWRAWIQGDEQDEAMQAVGDASIELDPSRGRLAATTTGYYDVAIADHGAFDDPLIEAELDGEAGGDLGGRGCVWFRRDPMEVRVWEDDGVCVAVRVTLLREPDE